MIAFRRRRDLREETSERQRAGGALRLVIEGTSRAVGADFLRALVRHLAAAFHVRFAFVSELHETDKGRARLLALWEGTGFGENFEYDTTGTPCEHVFATHVAYYKDNVQLTFPEDRWLKEKGIQSYLAIPLYDPAWNPVGHLGVMHDGPMPDDPLREPVLRILAARTGAELRRGRAAEALDETHAALEARVRERTAELERANDAMRREIARRERLEEALRQSEEKWRSLAANAPDFIITAGRDGTIQFANRTAIGQAPDEVIGKKIFDFLTPEYQDAVRGRLDRVFREGTSESLDLPAPGPGGTTAWYTARAGPIVHHGKVTAAVLIVADITKRKQAEERALQHQAELAHVLRVSTLGEMASGLAHELNQPLTAIVNYAEACVRAIRAGAAEPDTLVELMEEAAGEAQRAGSLIYELRKLVQKVDPHREPTDLTELVRTVVRLLGNELRQCRTTLALDGLWVHVNRVQIEQVMVNVVLNAAEAMREAGGQDRDLSIEASRAEEEGMVEVAVRDTGTGLSEGVAERMFEPFFTTKHGGLGMGLAISRSIIEAHGGRLWATANPDCGTTVRFTVPLHSAKERR